VAQNDKQEQMIKEKQYNYDELIIPLDSPSKFEFTKTLGGRKDHTKNE
jgi:hypothetical protein